MTLKYSKDLEDNIEYLEKLTRSWDKKDSNGAVSLYIYHDGVDWCHHYAIVINNEVKHLLKDVDYSQAYLAYETVVACLK